MVESANRSRKKILDEMRLAAQKPQPSVAKTPTPGSGAATTKAVVSDFSAEGISKSMMSLAKEPGTDAQQNFVNILSDTFRLAKIFKTRARLRICASMTYENGRFKHTEYDSSVCVLNKGNWVAKHNSRIPLDNADLFVREFATYMDGMGWVNNLDVESYFKENTKISVLPALTFAEKRSRPGPDGKDRRVVVECVLSLYTDNPNCSDDVPELSFATVIETDDAPSTVSTSVYFQRTGIPVA